MLNILSTQDASRSCATESHIGKILFICTLSTGAGDITKFNTVVSVCVNIHTCTCICIFLYICIAHGHLV